MPQEILPPLPDPERAATKPRRPRRDHAAEMLAADPGFVIDPDDLPPDLEFIPVPSLTKRWNGITPQKQRVFIAHLAASGCVKMAAAAIGSTNTGVYLLRKRPGAESFAQAWECAVEMGARRVLDTLMAHAIHGTPETLLQGGKVILERRKYNTRAMMWIVQQRFPEQYGGSLNLLGNAPHSLPHGIAKLKAKWRQEWEDERRAAEAEARRTHNVKANAQDTELDDRLRRIRTGFQRRIAHDPLKRAAWCLLAGPTDWRALIRPDAYANPAKHEWHMQHPDMIIPLAAGAGEIDWDKTGEDIADATWKPAAEEDEVWFTKYRPAEDDPDEAEPDAEARDAEGGDGEECHAADADAADEAGPNTPETTISTKQLIEAARLLHAEADAALNDPHPQFYTRPHGFLSNPQRWGGPTHPERDQARRAAEQRIEEAEKEWNAAYSEETWAAWKAGV